MLSLGRCSVFCPKCRGSTLKSASIIAQSKALGRPSWMLGMKLTRLPRRISRSKPLPIKLLRWTKISTPSPFSWSRMKPKPRLGSQLATVPQRRVASSLDRLAATCHMLRDDSNIFYHIFEGYLSKAPRGGSAFSRPRALSHPFLAQLARRPVPKAYGQCRRQEAPGERSSKLKVWMAKSIPCSGIAAMREISGLDKCSTSALSERPSSRPELGCSHASGLAPVPGAELLQVSKRQKGSSCMNSDCATAANSKWRAFKDSKDAFQRHGLASAGTVLFTFSLSNKLRRRFTVSYCLRLSQDVIRASYQLPSSTSIWALKTCSFLILNATHLRARHVQWLQLTHPIMQLQEPSEL